MNDKIEKVIREDGPGFIKKGGVEQAPDRPGVTFILQNMKPNQPIPTAGSQSVATPAQPSNDSIGK